jgi:creatine kinase
MGVFAMSPKDYDEFNPYYKKALEIYHKVDLDKVKHINNWDLQSMKGKIEGIPEDGELDLSKLGIPNELSMRVRTGRNLKKFPLPCGMTQKDRVDMEKTMGKVFDALIKNP